MHQKYTNFQFGKQLMSVQNNLQFPQTRKIHQGGWELTGELIIFKMAVRGKEFN